MSFYAQHYEFLSSKAYKILGLLRRTFSRDSSIHAKKILYLSLVKSKLTYCSPVWRPMFLKDVRSIENIQRRSTKYILNDYSSCYRSRLKELHILPLMMQFEINDILFFVTCLKNPTESFNILKYVNFSTNSTRSSCPSLFKNKLHQLFLLPSPASSLELSSLFSIGSVHQFNQKQANKVLLEPFHQIL